MSVEYKQCIKEPDMHDLLTRLQNELAALTKREDAEREVAFQADAVRNVGKAVAARTEANHLADRRLQVRRKVWAEQDRLAAQ